MPAAIKVMVWLPQDPTEFDGPLQPEVKVEHHVGEAWREPEVKQKSMDPAKIERFKILEVVDT